MGTTKALSCLVFLLLPIVFTQDIPQFIQQPVTQVVREDTFVILNCTVDSTEHNLTFSWTLNQLPISSSNNSFTLLSNNNSLSITSFNKALDGNYTCWVTNGNWTIRSRTAILQEAFILSPYDENTKTVNVARNNYTILDCIPDYSISNPTGNPYVKELIFVWIEGPFNYISSGQARTKNSAIHGPNGQLFLRKVTEDADYRCQVHNTLKNSYVEYNTQVRVAEVISTPSVTLLSQPSNMIVNIGEVVVMSCVTSDSSLFTWSVPNGVVFSSDNSANNQVITFTVTNSSYGGLYSCNSSGIPGVFSASLTIRNPPVILTSPPLTDSILWGTNTSLSCSASGTPPLEWVWFHNGVKVGSSSVLNINTASLSHTGAYQCFVRNFAGFANRNVYLNVHTIPPSFTEDGTLSNRLGFSGSNFTLTCNATGTPLPHYQWEKDKTIITSTDTNFDLTAKPGSLVFKSLEMALEGNYTCIVRSSIGGEVIGEVNSTGQVFVAGPTVITSLHHSHFSPYVGESFSLNCNVTHDAVRTDVRLTWSHNGTTVEDTPHTRLIVSGTNVTLFVSSSTPSDHGTYQCHVETLYKANTNLKGPTLHSTPTLISVTTVPSSPTVTSVALHTSTIAEVRWTYPGFVENVQSFRIDTRQEVSDWNRGTPFIQSSLTRRNITVVPYTVYTVRVVAILRNSLEINSLLYGPFTTLEDVPSTPPLSLRAVARSRSDVSLFWQAPSIPNGIITDYTISYWTHRDSKRVNVTLGSNRTTYPLVDLEGNTMYWIVIAAYTSVGRGPFSDSINYTTDPTIGGVNDGLSSPIHQRIWFIFTLCIIGVIIIVTIGGFAAAVRWRKKRKGHKYPVRTSFHAEESDFSPDVVADYEKRKKIEPINTLYMEEGEESVSSQTTIPPSFTYATYASSTDGGGGSIRLGRVPAPPSYINPPSFEETLKSRLNRRRSASMSLLEKAEHLHLSGSGWSVGHDPKSAFFAGPYDDTVDVDSVDKKRLHLPDDLSGGSSDSRIQSNPLTTRNGSLATFV